MTKGEERAFPEEALRIEALTQALEDVADSRTKELARGLMQAVLALHRAGLVRMLDLLAAAGEAGQAISADLGRDDLASSLLLLHGLHPVDLATRVGRALDAVRPYLHEQGSDVKLLALSGDSVRLRLECGPATEVPRLRRVLEDAVLSAAPDVTALDIQEVMEGRSLSLGKRVPLPLVGTMR